MKAFAVALDILREAASRKWFLALGGAVTLALAAIGFGLQMEVVDGALSATRFFGELLSRDIQSADVALRPVFQAASYLIFYGGLVFGILACADFAPSLLSPGRIEHLLALPVRRWELLAGTFLGVFALSVAGALYGAGGLLLILGVKTGVWTALPLVSALLASASFAAVYATMLTAALFVRSAAFSAAIGAGFFLGGIVASYRADLAPLFSRGASRAAFEAATAALPRIAALADAAASLAGSQPRAGPGLARLVLGVIIFGLAALALGVWRFDRKDF